MLMMLVDSDLIVSLALPGYVGTVSAQGLNAQIVNVPLVLADAVDYHLPCTLYRPTRVSFSLIGFSRDQSAISDCYFAAHLNWQWAKRSVQLHLRTCSHTHSTIMHCE